MSEHPFARPEDFYRVYDRHREYVRPDLRAKHIRQFDRHVWNVGGFAPAHAVLEIGCGTGIFLAYLAHKGITDFAGIDLDPLVKDHMPEDLAARVTISDVWDYLKTQPPARFERVVMLDVLEHFSAPEGVALLREIGGLLKPGGQVVVRVPNMSSPWGPIYQYHDLTHKAAYSPGALGQVALAAGFSGATCHPYRRGNGLKRALDSAATALLGRLFIETPEIWSANMMGVLRKP